MRRATSLQNAKVGVNRDIGSKYDNVKLVAANIDSVVLVAHNIANGLSYLGGHKSPPAMRLDGTPILDSDYYYNSEDDTLNYYSKSRDKWHTVDAQTAIDAANTATTKAAQTLQDAEATAADLIQTNEDQLQVAADREQVGLDTLAAAESASNASTSEENSAESARIASEAAALAAEVSGTAGKDSIHITLVSDSGTAFKNNTGQNKSLTAQVYIGGELSAGDHKYTWYAGGELAYVDVIGSYIGTSPGGGVYPADGTNMEIGLNFKTIIIDPSDVDYNSNLNLTCSVSNI